MRRISAVMAMTVAGLLVAPAPSQEDQGETISYTGKLVDPDVLLQQIGAQMGLRVSGGPGDVDVAVAVLVPEQRVDVTFLNRRPTAAERAQLDGIYSALPAVEGGAAQFRARAARRQQQMRDRYAAAATDGDRIQILAEYVGLAEPR